MCPSAPTHRGQGSTPLQLLQESRRSCLSIHTLSDVRLCSQDETSYTGGGCRGQKSQTVLTKLHRSSGAGGTDQQNKRMEL